MDVVKAAFAMSLDQLFAEGLVAQLQKKGPFILRESNIKPPVIQNANGLPEFLRRSMDGDRCQKLAELSHRFCKPLMMLNKGNTGPAEGLVSTFQWMCNGRRVYSLDADLERVLATTSPAAFAWSELHFPFPSFAIKLATPIRFSEEGDLRGAVSTIVVTRMSAEECRAIGVQGGGENLFIWILPDDIKRYTVTSEAERLHWMRRVRNLRASDDKEVRAITNFIMRLNAERREYRSSLDSGAVVRLSEFVLDRPIKSGITDLVLPSILESSSTSAQQSISDLDRMCALVANFLIYLKTAHHARCAKEAKSEWVRKPFTGKPAPGEIVTDTQIFKVLHSFQLTVELREAMDAMIRNPGDRDYMLRTGFRCAHWRRPPGRGHIDEAEKTVHVSMTILNPANRAPGTLPGGATAKLR